MYFESLPILILAEAVMEVYSKCPWFLKPRRLPAIRKLIF